MNDEVRATYMELMANGVPASKCHTVVKAVLNKLAQTNITRLPKASLAKVIQTEAAVLSKIQCGRTITEGENNTIHLDGTRKKFREFNTVNITTGEGQSMSLGFDEMAGGSTQDYLTSTFEMLKEIAELLLPLGASNLQREKTVGELLAKIKNTMTDHHIVNKSFNERFQEIRRGYMALINDNLADLQKEELEDLLHMNNLFCSAHVIGNCGSVAKNSLKDYEDFCELKDYSGKGTSRSFQFLHALSKATTSAHDYQKAGVAHWWEAYCEAEGIENKLISLRGERINIIFLLGGAAYYHRDHLTDFFEKNPATNKLTSAVQRDIQDPVILSACRALGIIGQMITDPLFRIISDTDHIFDLNEVWDDVMSQLASYAEDPSRLIQGIAPECLADNVQTSNGKHEALFKAEPDLYKLCALVCR